MKSKKKIIVKKDTARRLTIWAVIVAAVLMVPFLARFPWTVSDFVFAAIVLFGSAAIYEFATRSMVNKTHRIFVAIAVIMFIIIIWGMAVAS